MNQIFLIFCLASFFNFCWASGPIVLKPNDPFVFLGECLTLYCSLSSIQYGNSSTLYITLNGKMFSDDHYEIVDENTMKFNRCISDSDESGTYICKENATDLFNGQVVRVEKALVPIPNDSIKCLVMDWRFMNCTWSLGQTYKDPNEIQVDLTFKIISSYDPAKCPKLLQTSCQWTRSDADLSMPFLMNLTVSHKRRPGVKVVTAFDLPRKKTVKPSQVNLAGNSIFTNTSCFKIEWTHNYSYKLTYNITLYSKDEGKQTILRKKKYLQMCKLLPGKNYKVWISAFPKRGPGIWSDPLFLDIFINGTHPSQPPSINNSSFAWNLDHSGVFLYWQSLTRRQSGAENVRYLIDVENQITQAYSGNTVIKLPLHKPGNECWLLQIWAVNSFGRSKSSSKIEICNDTSVPVASEMVEILILNDTFVEVMWRKLSLETASVSRFKVLACKNYSVDLQWWVIDTNKSSIVLQLDDPDTYLFGVAAENQNGSSGLTLGYCYYYRNKPRTPIAGFSVQSIYDKLQVDWKPYNCLVEKAFIIEYQVKYCVALNDSVCNERIKVNSVPRSRRKFQTSELSPNGYLVWMEPVTYAGSGPSSIKRMVKIPNSSLSTKMVIVIAVVSFVVFILIILGCKYIFNHCASQMAECDPKIDFPKINQDEDSGRIISNSNSSSTSDQDSSPTSFAHTDITHLSTNSHSNSSMCNGLVMDPDLQASHTYMKIGVDNKESLGKSSQSSLTFSRQFTQKQNANNNAVNKEDYVDPNASDKSFDRSRSSKNSHDNILDDDNISFSDSNSLCSILGQFIGSQTTGDDALANKSPDVKNVQENNQNCVENNLKSADRNVLLTKTVKNPSPTETLKNNTMQIGVGYSDSKKASENISKLQNTSLQFIPNQNAQKEDDYIETSAFSSLSDQSRSSTDSHDQLLDDNDSSFSNSSFGFNNGNFNECYIAVDATDNYVSNITGFCNEKLMIPNLKDDSQKRGVRKDGQIAKILSRTETSLEMSFLPDESDKDSPKIEMKNGFILKNNVSSTKEQMPVNLPNNKSGNGFITDKSDNDTYVFVDDKQNDDDAFSFV